MQGQVPGGGRCPGGDAGGDAWGEMPGEVACYPENHTLTSTYSGI